MKKRTGLFCILLTSLFIATSCNQNQLEPFSSNSIAPSSISSSVPSISSASSSSVSTSSSSSSSISSLISSSSLNSSESSSSLNRSESSSSSSNSSYIPDVINDEVKAFSFSSVDDQEKIKILSLLEKYAIENNLGGLPLYETSPTEKLANTLPLNTCDAALWEKLFGENGSIVKTPKDKYWEVKPIMSNKHFLHGLNYALNRAELVKQFGANSNLVPSVEILTPFREVELLDYWNTEEHKQNLNYYFTDKTDAYGYSLEEAKNSFVLAAQDMIDQGFNKAGDTIYIELVLTEGLSQTIGDFIKNCFESAFNVSENPLKLSIVRLDYSNNKMMNIIYDKLLTGQYDIGYGRLTGSSPHSFDYFYYLRSDSVTSMTCNWGKDTSIVDDSLIYQGTSFSFDALLEAAEDRAFVQNGQLYKPQLLDSKITKLDNGGLKAELWTNDVFIDEQNFSKQVYINLCGLQVENYDDYIGDDQYLEIKKYPTYNSENKSYVYEFSSDEVGLIGNEYPYFNMIDLYFNQTIDGLTFKPGPLNGWRYEDCYLLKSIYIDGLLA